MNNVLYPLTYLGLCPFMIVLARALQTKKGFQPTFLAVTPAEGAYAANNLDEESLVLSLSKTGAPVPDVLATEAQYQSVYGFMKSKYGGTDRIWRNRVNLLYRTVESVIEKRKISLIVLWNGNDCMGRVCQILADKHGLKTVFLENGYFPNTLQIDPKGVNAEASVTEVPATAWNAAETDLVQQESAAVAAQVIAPTATFPLSLQQRIQLKLESIFSKKYYDRYPELRDQKERKQVKTALPLSSTAEVLVRQKPFALVVLQVHDDTQILLNSRLFKSPREFLQHCYNNIREVFGPNFEIVVKLHPVDMNRICYAEQALKMRNTSWIGAEPVQPLLEQCAFVMVVNSSVGLQSIAMHKPTVVFGESFYSRGEICQVVKTPGQTRQLLNELKQGSALVDSNAVDRFLAYLRHHYFVRGSWSLGPDTDLAPAVEKIHRILAGSAN